MQSSLSSILPARSCPSAAWRAIVAAAQAAARVTIVVTAVGDMGALDSRAIVAGGVGCSFIIFNRRLQIHDRALEALVKRPDQHAKAYNFLMNPSVQSESLGRDCWIFSTREPSHAHPLEDAARTRRYQLEGTPICEGNLRSCAPSARKSSPASRSTSEAPRLLQEARGEVAAQVFGTKFCPFQPGAVLGSPHTTLSVLLPSPP